MNLKQIRLRGPLTDVDNCDEFFVCQFMGLDLWGWIWLFSQELKVAIKTAMTKIRCCVQTYKRIDEADAVCYRRNGRMLFNKYGPGSGTIWLDGVNCTGAETSIADCRHNGWGVNDCEHRDDVSISCVELQSPLLTSSKNCHSSNSSVERWAGKKM